ncbi:MAG: HRDC domain-containing protein [Lewinellaceae bacterium]|nr:HRDC domain-containing protein [Phaeodactylibacter sp.]MCB9036784.1 HRDC domain-containing protein [Lewinellaceae bacterium]
MQIKYFTIPVFGGEKLNEDLNVFLRSKKILRVENQLVSDGQGSFWCVCVRYLDDSTHYDKRERKKIDYREVLDEASFERFSRLREIRKQAAKQENVEVYLIFTNEELAGLARLAELTPASMKTVKGIGEKKAEKIRALFYLETAGG